MKCDICDMPAVINDLCQGCYDDLAKGGDDALRAAEMFQLRIAELKSESNKLHDALERQSELIAGLRNEIATKDKRIADLRIAVEAGLRISETNQKAQHRIGDLEQTVLYLTAQCQECVEQLSEGKEYSEGCKP